MKYLLGVDFGGGSSKATLIDETGKAVCTASCEYPMLFPDIGWSEQNPEDLYVAFISNIRSILSKSGIRPDEIEAVSLDGGTHIAVLLDDGMNVIRPAIYWSDIRSADQARRLGEKYGDEIRELGYNNVGALWTLPQLLWLKENEPENHGRIRHILFLKDYIRYRITSILATDSIEAMGALMMDAGRNVWSEWLCSLCGISVDQMPPIVEPDEIIGTVTPEASRETGLSDGYGHGGICFRRHPAGPGNDQACHSGTRMPNNRPCGCGPVARDLPAYHPGTLVSRDCDKGLRLLPALVPRYAVRTGDGA